MASGEVASSVAVAAILKSFTSSAFTGVPISTRLLHAINTANQDVWAAGQVAENRGMGTTAVVAARDGDKLILGNVGDSRAYMIQGGQCVQLTVDHSYVNELIRNGTLTIENAQSADLQGMESSLLAQSCCARSSARLLFGRSGPRHRRSIGTDGLTRYVQQDEIPAILSASPFESACANLIQVAKERGGGQHHLYPSPRSARLISSNSQP